MDDVSHALIEFQATAQARRQAEEWLTSFEPALLSRNPVQIGALFHEECHWRDILAFTWHLSAFAGRDELAARLAAEQGRASAHGFHLPSNRKAPRRVKRLGKDSIEAIFEFGTTDGRAAGLLRLSAAGDGTMRAWHISTVLEALRGHEEQIGANRPSGSAYSRNFGGDNWADMRRKAAAYEDREVPSRMYVKQHGTLWVAEIGQSPLDVVAWHGNYAPYKYDLRRFSPIGPLLFDHADPSIFTVLTAPSETPGTANVDFVCFPDRWTVAEDTFRPPWYHMNCMSEFMGLIYGQYDAKPQGFVPGGFSLHNAMLPHGPDAEAFQAASTAALAPRKLAGTMAFMFESRHAQRVTRFAAEHPALQAGYADCWAGLRKTFDPTRP